MTDQERVKRKKWPKIKSAYLTKSFATRGHMKHSYSWYGDYLNTAFRETARSEELKLFDPTSDSNKSIADGKHNGNMAVGIEFRVGEDTERVSYFRVFLTASDVARLVKLSIKRRK